MPQQVYNFIMGEERPATSHAEFEKRSPHDNALLFTVARSFGADVDAAVQSVKDAQPDWAAMPGVRRGHVLHQVCNLLEARQNEIAAIVARETGKSQSEALGEAAGAIALGRFYAGEGQRLYGRTTTSGTSHKQCMTVRQPCGVAGLIVAANTPIANVAWKVFPALICGNGVVLKAAEDTPATAWLFTKICYEAGLPKGILATIQGIGPECGPQLVEHSDVDVVSFTGSTRVGRQIGEVCGRLLKKVSLELGGKNPFIVCDDADLDNAVNWLCLSAFSNAGQRCAAGSRAIVFDSVYDAFVEKLVTACKTLRLGPHDGCDLGPVINERQLNSMIAAVEAAQAAGAKVLAGGGRLTTVEHSKGWYMAPTILTDVDRSAEITRQELFGPIVSIYRVADFETALSYADDSPYGLTAAIHTKSFDRAMIFAARVRSGVAIVNAGTFGSEPHMPFGGLKNSGNGTREPGTEALDIYSELKDVYLMPNPERL